MNIVIIGQGAIGLLWYHKLSKQASNQVSLQCSARITQAPKHSLFTDRENHTTSQPLTLATASDLQTADVILVCLKSYNIAPLLPSLAKIVSTSTSVIFCHNGMINPQQFLVLNQPCYTLLTTHASKIIEPFHTKHTGLGHNDIGLICGDAERTQQEKVIQCLAEALPTVSFSENINTKQWLKLAINCVINPITAINNIANGAIVHTQFQQQIAMILKEVVLIAEHDGVLFDHQQLIARVLTVAKNTADNCSSMRSDILQQRRTEIDDINGYVVNLAKRLNITLVENERLVREIKALEYNNE